MSVRHLSYYSGWEAEILTYPSCGWRGTFNNGDTELYEELMDSSCPQCDEAPMLAIVSYATLEETRDYLDKLSPEEQEKFKDREGLLERLKSEEEPIDVVINIDANNPGGKPAMATDQAPSRRSSKQVPGKTEKRFEKLKPDSLPGRGRRQPMSRRYSEFGEVLDRLTLDDIPGRDAAWQVINEFTLTFDGYAVWGEDFIDVLRSRTLTGMTRSETCALACSSSRDGITTSARVRMSRQWNTITTCLRNSAVALLLGKTSRCRRGD